MATASYDQTVRLWGTRNGELVQTLTGHTGNVLSVSLSPDGKFLATASRARGDRPICSR